MNGKPLVFNDPLGGQECLVWRLGTAVLVSSEIPTQAIVRPTNLGIDWIGLANHLPNLSLAPEAAPLTGVTTVGPGCLYDPDSGQQTRVWSPATVISSAPSRAAVDPVALRDIVDDTVATLAQGRERIISDISGGLDSAIVTAALARGRRVGGVHQRFPEPEGDEFIHARSIADRLGVPLTILDRGPIAWTASLIEATADGARPSTNAIDCLFDQLLADHLERENADALFTGHGGDAVFYQSPNVNLFAEALLSSSGGRGRLTAAANVAYRRRSSYFGLIRDAWRSHRAPPEGQVPGWLADAHRVSPARRMQIVGLNYARHRFGRSLRERVCDLIDPLFSQPVVEWCLRTPIMGLTGGDIDRTLAREAFSERLPQRVVWRARKGDVSVFFSKSILNSRAFLRDYLLGGRLREKGLLDPKKVEAALDPQAILWRHVIDQVLPPLAAEAWVRVTEARLSGAEPRR
ncbi:asparagine synthase-related protein [Caulobacter sp. 73W]|uniref:Asparagine synthase-related protein n=1 Tax=Caulobacter sp. 73W TaxID=3161137 RepID=A0AB39KR59_9CAUL